LGLALAEGFVDMQRLMVDAPRDGLLSYVAPRERQPDHS
jgi:hypothetical protein